MQTEGINIVAREVNEGKVLVDERWELFSTKELQILVDGLYTYDSGIDPKSVQRMCRELLTALNNRDEIEE